MNYSFPVLARSISLFVLAGLCEIGGVVLILYGVVPTLQPAHFARVYAVYGGFFIVLSLLWGWWFDGKVPDRFDVFGAVISLAGLCFMMYWPRSAALTPQ